jgi:predicted nucleic acid-binding protein
MDVLDSNLWVFAVTGTNRTAIELVEDAVAEKREIATSAYVYQEVLHAFERSTALSRTETDEAIEDFLAVLRGYPTIHADFTQGDVRALDFEAYRLRPNSRLLATVLAFNRRTSHS